MSIIENEEKWNEKLRDEIKMKKQHRFHQDAKNWYCDNCKKRINTYDGVYHCFECPDFDFCRECYPKHKDEHNQKFHQGENFFSFLPEPNWYFTYRQKEDVKGQNTQNIIKTCFEFYHDRKYIGYRNSVDVKKLSYYTYNQVYERMKNVANGLRQLGIERGDFIAIHGDNSIDYIILLFACWYSGVTVVPIQLILSIEEKRYILQKCLPKALFFSLKYEKDMLELLGNNMKSLTGLDAKKLFLLDGNQSSKYIQLLEIEDLGKTSSEFTPKPNDKDHICTIIYTSGTTGLPKGIVFREPTWVIEMTRMNMTLPLVQNSFLPYSHISGIGDFLIPFFNGGRCVLLTNNDFKNVYEDFKITRPTVLSTIPRILIYVYNQYHQFKSLGVPENEIIQELKGLFGDRLLDIVVGSAPCPKDVKDLIRRIYQLPVYDGYGISEVGTVSFSYNKQNGTEYKLIDCPELGYFKSDKPFPRGELLVKNELTKDLEYFKDTKTTKEKFDSLGFFRTGDIVELHPNNKIVIIDRKHNVVKLSQGEFVNLENLETLFEQISMIDQIILTADPKNIAIVALVLPVDNKNITKGMENKIGKEIIEIAKKEKLESYQIPKSILLVPNPFVLTELKKKNRKRIKNQYSKELEQLYQDLYTNSVPSSTGNGNGSTKKKEMSMIEFFLKSRNLDLKTVDKNLSLAQLGGDSLTGTILIKNLKIMGKRIDFSSLMNKPIKELQEFLAENQKTQNQATNEDDIVELKKESKRYQQLLDDLQQEHEEEIEDNESSICYTSIRSIFLTGYTGFIGQFLLTDLKKYFPSAKIYVLIRKESLGKIKGLKDNKRIEIVIGDFSKSHLGLSSEQFNKLSEEIDIVLHAGSMVNHLLDYEDHYDANVQGIFEITKLARGYKPIVYLSSSSVYSGFPIQDDITKEKHQHKNGYSASKWIADCLLSKQYPNHIIFRLPLVIGSKKTGQMNKKDWFTKIIQGVYDFKMIPTKIPNLDYGIDMVSVDSVSYLIVKSILNRNFSNVFNISFENISFSTVFAHVNKYLLEKENKKLEEHEYFSWNQKITKEIENKNHPIAPFVSTIEGIGKYEKIDTFYTKNVLMVGDQNYPSFKKLCYNDIKKYLDYILKEK